MSTFSESDAPSCGNAHKMIVSRYDGYLGGYHPGYVCDKCSGRSATGHREGSRERWFCYACWEDFCFTCIPKK